MRRSLGWLSDWYKFNCLKALSSCKRGNSVDIIKELGHLIERKDLTNKQKSALLEDNARRFYRI